MFNKGFMAGKARWVLAGLACAILGAPGALAQTKPTVTVVNTVSNPVNTRITNSVLPVEISNADPIPTIDLPPSIEVSSFYSENLDFGFGASGSGTRYSSLPDDVALTGIAISVQALPASSGFCKASVTIVAPDSSVPANDVLLVDALYRIEVSQGQTAASPFIPLPRLVVPANARIRTQNTSTYTQGAEPINGDTCRINVTVQGLRQ